MDKNAVLSLSPSKETLIVRETALRSAGMTVVSVVTPMQATFEIEMGRCGNLLICYRLSLSEANGIAKFYRRYCPKGHIVFVTKSHPLPPEQIPVEVDAYVPEASGPDTIVHALQTISW